MRSSGESCSSSLTTTAFSTGSRATRTFDPPRRPNPHKSTHERDRIGRDELRASAASSTVADDLAGESQCRAGHERREDESDTKSHVVVLRPIDVGMPKRSDKMEGRTTPPACKNLLLVTTSTY